MPWLLVVGCSTGDDDDDDTLGDDDASQGDDDDDTTQPPVQAKLTVDSITPGEGGVVTVSYTLVGSSGSTFDVYPSFSYNGKDFEEAHPLGGEGTSGLAGSPAGSTHAFQWDTIRDLGYVDTNVWFSLSGEGDGYELTAVVKPVAISNKQFDKPCTIDAVEVAEGDGPITVQYTLRDEAGDDCDVRVEVEITGARDTATALPGSDPLEDVQASPEGAPRHFIWDSEVDVPRDQLVSLVFTAEDDNNEQVDRFDVQVKNSPVPDPGEIIFTEVLPWPFAAPAYIEVYNVSNHALNLRELWLQVKSVPDDKENVLLSPGQDFMMPARTFVVIGQYQEAYVDLSAPSLGISKQADQLRIWRGDLTSPIVIDDMSYNIDSYGGVGKAFGHAISLLAGAMDAQANDTASNWCLEQSGLEGYSSDFGTPGEAPGCTAAPAAEGP